MESPSLTSMAAMPMPPEVRVSVPVLAALTMAVVTDLVLVSSATMPSPAVVTVMAVATAGGIAPAGAQVQIRRDGDFVVATVTARSNLLRALDITGSGVSAV